MVVNNNSLKLEPNALALLAEKHKVHQVVWVPSSVFADVLKTASELGLAANQTLVLLAAAALRGQPFIVNAPAQAPAEAKEVVKEVVKQVVKHSFVCPLPHRATNGMLITNQFMVFRDEAAFVNHLLLHFGCSMSEIIINYRDAQNLVAKEDLITNSEQQPSQPQPTTKLTNNDEPPKSAAEREAADRAWTQEFVKGLFADKKKEK